MLIFWRRLLRIRTIRRWFQRLRHSYVWLADILYVGIVNSSEIIVARGLPTQPDHTVATIYVIFSPESTSSPSSPEAVAFYLHGDTSNMWHDKLTVNIFNVNVRSRIWNDDQKKIMYRKYWCTARWPPCDSNLETWRAAFKCYGWYEQRRSSTLVEIFARDF